MQQECARKHTGLAEASGLPCAMALRLIRDRPGDRLSCHHRSRAALAAIELDASTGASDPNDFTVRNGCARLSHHRVHRIPPRVSDDPDTPLVWDGMAELYERVGGSAKRNIFARRDGPRSCLICPSGYFVAGGADIHPLPVRATHGLNRECACSFVDSMGR